MTHELPEDYRKIANPPGQGNTDVFTISSRVVSFDPAVLVAAGPKATDKPDRLIDDGSRAWHDSYRSNWGHPPLWRAFTRKLKDPKWHGPEGAKLVFDIRCESDNRLVVEVETNGWGAVEKGKPAISYNAVKQLKGSPDWQTVSVSLDELAATDRKFTAPLTNWRTATQFSIGPSGDVVRDGAKQPMPGKPWVGPREIRNLRWE